MRDLDRGDVLVVHAEKVGTRAGIIGIEALRRGALILENRRRSRRVFLEGPVEC